MLVNAVAARAIDDLYEVSRVWERNGHSAQAASLDAAWATALPHFVRMLNMTIDSFGAHALRVPEWSRNALSGRVSARVSIWDMIRAASPGCGLVVPSVLETIASERAPLVEELAVADLQRMPLWARRFLRGCTHRLPRATAQWLGQRAALEIESACADFGVVYSSELLREIDGAWFAEAVLSKKSMRFRVETAPDVQVALVHMLMQSNWYSS